MTKANGETVFDRTSGEHEDDKTSFHPGQRTWGPNKPNWPPLDHQLEKRDYRDPVYEVPIWMDHGRVVLDPDNHPVKRFREIPTTCSSEMEGWLMEGIRRQNSSIGYKDFRARMPRSPGANQDKPLYSLSTFSMRGTRFREKHGLLSWDTRAGTARLNEYFRGLKSQASITSNSTLNERDPTEVEIAESKRLNKGKHSERAGLRKLATEERQKRDQAAQRKLEKLKAKEAAANPTSVPGKRRRQAEQTIDDDGGDSDLERGDAKRRRKDPQQIRGNQPYWNGPQEILPHQHSYSRDAFHHQPFPQQAPSNATGYVGRDSQSHPGQYPNIHGSYGFEALAQAQQSSGSYPSVYSPDTMNDISRYWSELRRSELRRSELRRAPEPNFDQYGNEAFARAPLQQAHPSSQPQFYTSAEWMPVNQGLTEIETNQAVGIHNPVLFDTTQPAAVHPASQTRTTTPVSLENHIEPGTIVPWQVHDVNPSYAQQVYQNAVDESYGTGNDEVWEEPPPVDDNVDYLLPVDETRHHQDQTDEEFRFFDTMTEQEVDQWNQNTFGNIMANSSSLLQEDGDTTLLGDDTTVQGDGDTTLQGDAITSLIEAAKGKSLEPETPADELSTDQAQPAIVSGGEVVSNSEPVDPDPSEEEAKAIVEKIAQKVLQKEAQDEGFEDETTAWNEAFPWEDLDTFIANNLHTIVDPLDQNPAVATQGNDDPDHASHHQDEAPESSNHGESTHERNTDGLIDESFDPSERPDSSEAVQNEKPEPEQGSANAHTEENLGGWGYCF